MTILAWIVAVTLFLGGCSGAPTPKVYRVGILSGADTMASITDGFKAKMTELGYVEGKNVVYDVQKTGADLAAEQSVAKKFVDDKVDLIFAFPTGPAAAAKAATQGTNIPVVFAMAGIEDNDLVKSVREPGGNITGVRFPGPDLTLKRFEFLLEVAPQVKRLYVPYDPNYPNNPPALKALRPAASSKGVTLVEAQVANVEELQADLQGRAEASDIGMDAIMIMPELLATSPAGWGAITKFAAEHKLPIAGSALSTADSGAIFSYSAVPLEVGKLTAPLADKILKGAQAGTIPVASPEASLRINYKAAQALGLTVPEGLLAQASEIIR